jgi:hypothetical protein
MFQGWALMQITAERAFWMLEYYRRHLTVLAFGGRILGEEAACEASISFVWPEAHAIGVKLLSEDRKNSWDRLVSLKAATFSLVQMGDPDFDDFASDAPIHSVLVIGILDGTTMFMAELAGSVEATTFYDHS